MYNPSSSSPFARRGGSLDLPASPTAAAAAGTTHSGPLPRLTMPPLRAPAPAGGGGGRSLLHTVSMPPPSPSARAAAAAAAAAAATGATGVLGAAPTPPRTAPSPGRHKIQGIDAFEFADIVRSL
jgi:hypothetical protein